MTREDGSRKRTVLFGSIAAALVVLLAFGGWLWSRRQADTSLADGGLKVKVDGPADGKRSIEVNGVKLNGNGELSEADQKKLMAGAASHRTEMLDAYFKLAPGKERKDHLDKIIDQQEEMRKMIGDPTTQPAGITTSTSTGPNGEQKQKVMIRAKADPKTATEGIPPGDRARMAEMMADLNARRAERGLPPQNGFMMVRTSK